MSIQRQLSPACLLLCLFLTMPVVSSATSDSVLTAPWREALISVRDLDSAAGFFIEVGRFEQLARGQLAAGEIAYWQLDETADAEFLLLRAPGADHGFLRLVRFDGVEQRPIRVGARAWDSGGYFSLMMRARDLDLVYADALALGWMAESEPVRFDFGPSVLANVVLKGPDGINIALYERLAPPLDDFWQFERLSQPFNAMQMVADIERADAFFTGLLGMQHFWSGDFLDPAPGPNNFGLPQNLTTEIPRRTRILQPKPGETGRLELMQFVGLDGRDLSERAKPPNLGILSVRYPVANAGAALADIESAGGSAWRGPAEIDLPPYGRVNIFAVRAPDGAIVEILSPVDTDPAAAVAAALAGSYDNADQYQAAPDALKVPPSVQGDWLDHQHAIFTLVNAPAIGEQVLYLEWRSGGPDGPISRQRIWSFRTDPASGQVRMDFYAFVDGDPWAGLVDQPDAFVSLDHSALRGYGPDCALRFTADSSGGWHGIISADECSLVASSGRRMGIDASVELEPDGTLHYRESGRLESGQYAFRVPPTKPYRFRPL
ncbi:MAG: CpcT/CpeT family chromophore lyase [Wenzhouxiangella sp.]|nr:CpcT/CpeT family chromophore lyase [Wenzhouxiangella sp.]